MLAGLGLRLRFQVAIWFISASYMTECLKLGARRKDAQDRFLVMTETFLLRIAAQVYPSKIAHVHRWPCTSSCLGVENLGEQTRIPT